ncbi:MAG: serine/threonine-protein kinase [Polyangiaceae bacterium]|jgi:serine/threonine protein kinase
MQSQVLPLAENMVIAERFRLTRVIGRGGMGTVWQATNVRLDVPCAIKFIEGEHIGDAVALARFEREAKAAAQIRSAHVVQILDHGTFRGRPYIAMELLEGEDLGRRLRRTLKMSPRDVAAIVTHVCRALSKAHGMEIVHRDLKPENIFLAWDDDREIAKVLDFGIAKRVQADIPSHTTEGAMLGTPVYMSPEQAQGAKGVDYRSDLWALAVIAFRCLTGVLPFRSESLADLLVKIIVHPLPVPSQITVDVPPGFDAWWARAASRDPNRRFQSAKELAQTLVDALGVPPLSDGLERRVRDAAVLPDQFPPPPTPPQAVAAPRVAPHAGVSSTLSLPPQSTGSPLARTFGDTPPTAPPPSRSTVPTLVATGIALLAIGGIAMFMVSHPRGSLGAAATSAGAVGVPVVPEVVEEEEVPVPKASSAPSAVPSAAAAASASGRPARALH